MMTTTTENSMSVEPCITGIDARYRPAPVERDAATAQKKHEPEKPSTH
jgi:hypothetical protein